jgi:hypothetical protein
MGRKAVSEGYTATAVCAAVGVPRTSFDAWVLRGYLPLMPGPGTGRARALTLLDAIRFAAMGQLTRLGIPVAAAGKAARNIEPRMIKAPRRGQRWMMVLGPARSEEATGPLLIGACKGLADVEHLAGSHLPDLTTFVVMDISTIAERITSALENDDDGQTAHKPRATSLPSVRGAERADPGRRCRRPGMPPAPLS